MQLLDKKWEFNQGVEEESSFRKFAASLPCFAFELDNSGKLIYANAALLSFTGHRIEEIHSGSNILNIFDSWDFELLQNGALNRPSESAGGKSECEIISKIGKRIPIEVFASTIGGESGKSIGLRCIAFDISERKRIESSILQNALELDRVFNTASGAMCIINKDFSIRRMNDEFATTFGIDPIKSLGRKCNEVLARICCDRVQCPLTQILGGANRIEQETEAEISPAEKANFHLTVVPYCDRAGTIIGMVSNFRNITEIKLIQRQLQQATLLATLGEMTAGIAHEVNNPLSSILLYSELLMAGGANPKIRKDLKLIHDEAERASRTMSELLNYARGINTSMTTVNLNTLVKKVLEVRSYQQNVKNIHVTRNLSRAGFYIQGDSNQITQVIMNIVMNAEDSINEKKGGDINITTEISSKWGRLFICDSGKGIKEEDLQKIFFPFFTTKKNAQRSGLGLSVCYGIVTRHHGFIKAKNNPSGGTTFIVELPLVQRVSKKPGRTGLELAREHD